MNSISFSGGQFTRIANIGRKIESSRVVQSFKHVPPSTLLLTAGAIGLGFWAAIWAQKNNADSFTPLNERDDTSNFIVSKLRLKA